MNIFIPRRRGRRVEKNNSFYFGANAFLTSMRRFLTQILLEIRERKLTRHSGVGDLQHVRIARNADRCNSHGRSVCLSVRPSVTFRCFVQTNEHTIVRSLASARTIIPVSEEVKFIWIFAWDHPSDGV